MKIDKSKIKLADEVLAAFKKTGMTGSFTLSTFRNGRENGYVLTDNESEASVTFSENRNSDDIVIYPGDWYSSITSQDELYEGKMFALRIKDAVSIIRRTFLSAREQK